MEWHIPVFVTPFVKHWMEQEIAEWVHHKGVIRWPITPWADTTTELHLAPLSGPVAYMKEMFYLMTHSTHFIYSYMASDIWPKIIQIAREESHSSHMGYSFRLAARVLLYAPSHRQDSTYHGLWYTSHGALAGTRKSSMGPPWRIDPMIHRTRSEHLPWSYISIPVA